MGGERESFDRSLARVAKALSQGQLPVAPPPRHIGIGKGVAALANMLGLDRVVEGRIMLKGDVEIDTRAPPKDGASQAWKLSFHTEGDCKLSYLPSP